MLAGGLIGRVWKEGLLGDVTEVLDLGLQAPVPLVLCKQGVLVEETARHISMSINSGRLEKSNIPRIEPAHGVVALKTTVHDSSIALLGDTLFPHLWIKPVRVSPHVMIDFAKLHRAGRVVLDRVLEGRVELSIIEEDIRVVIPAVEVALDRLDGLDDAVQLLVSGEDHEGAVCSRSAGVRFETSYFEDFVVLFTDFSVAHRLVRTYSWSSSCGIGWNARTLLLEVNRQASMSAPARMGV